MDYREKPPKLPSREEMDAKLGELRADPEMAARFKADLHEKRRKALDKLPKSKPPLDQLISEAFSFLVHEYGFTEHSRKMVNRFASTTRKEYSNATVRIYVDVGGYDVGAFCGIGFENKESGDHHRFENLVLKRCPQFQHPPYGRSTEEESVHLKMYADALRNYAGDVLLGDFGAFHE
ncbi:MAG TPA: hypothetical protein VJ837_02310 [Candidatus Paceibacterota bacterium]|nr:hypothetical protein [Candidatus Paceibacterota bacterium]